ncbi:hypothetical protein [Ramlibacter sp.]|uniref:hypothetical protein n=1 Tax=Ramlibacter sp. TaxID=1917967 RepID=UPI002C553B8B|nr:hypothetical protein [Ramlibacter sp.]HWI81281.1 hypothetical protein [Ramlibacter sp.]
MQQPTRIGGIARWHLLFGLTFAALGMLLGIYMAISHNHVERPAHAHVMLLGFVVSTLYAIVYQVWLKATPVRLAMVQTICHQLGALVLSLGLVLMFGGVLPEAQLEPVLAVGALSALAGVLLMIFQVLRVAQERDAPAAEAVLPGAV